MIFSIELTPNHKIGVERNKKTSIINGDAESKMVDGTNASGQ
jgi:hypothetical protein